MSVEERDPVSGHNTTGHEWNGIKELDTPVPRGVLIFLIVTHIFAILWWFLMPTWPLGETNTKGLLRTDQWKEVNEELRAAELSRAPWVRKIAQSTPEHIEADPQLMAIVGSTGERLFGDNCAACHGRDGKGGDEYPDLTDSYWQYGGSVSEIAETMRVGVNTDHPDTRAAQMPAFGEQRLLDYSQIDAVAAYVYALSHPSSITQKNRAAIATGREVFAANCAACHGPAALGNPELGAPNLTDPYWIYGGELDDIITAIHKGRRGHMPTWDERLTDTEIKILALYVHSLGEKGE